MCPYQDPANYTLDIVNENGAVVDSTGTKEACTATIETFTTRIVTSQSYMVRLTITQRHFIKQALLNISVPKFGKINLRVNKHKLCASVMHAQSWPCETPSASSV